jgi:hypothetical protein
MAASVRERARDCLRTLWAIRHCHDHKFKAIVRGLIREDVARLRGLQQPTSSR